MNTSIRFPRRTPFFTLTGKRGLSFLLLLFLLSFSVSCEFWEDWCDGDKPPPSDPLTPPHTARTVYTRDEAISLVCNKLIMKFSMMSGKPSVSCRDSDDMARDVAALLRKANAIGSDSSDAASVCSLESAPAKPGFWHPVAVHISTGKVLLDETIPLASAENGAL